MKGHGMPSVNLTRLKLRRKHGEAVWVGESRVTWTKDGLLIEAPAEVRVLREEIRERESDEHRHIGIAVSG